MFFASPAIVWPVEGWELSSEEDAVGWQCLKTVLWIFIKPGGVWSQWRCITSLQGPSHLLMSNTGLSLMLWWLEVDVVNPTIYINSLFIVRAQHIACGAPVHIGQEDQSPHLLPSPPQQLPNFKAIFSPMRTIPGPSLCGKVQVNAQGCCSHSSLQRLAGPCRYINTCWEPFPAFLRGMPRMSWQHQFWVVGQIFHWFSDKCCFVRNENIFTSRSHGRIPVCSHLRLSNPPGSGLCLPCLHELTNRHRTQFAFWKRPKPRKHLIWESYTQPLSLITLGFSHCPSPGQHVGSILF